jgi:predicted Zn-dependent protease
LPGIQAPTQVFISLSFSNLLAVLIFSKIIFLSSGVLAFGFLGLELLGPEAQKCHSAIKNLSSSGNSNSHKFSGAERTRGEIKIILFGFV